MSGNENTRNTTKRNKPKLRNAERRKHIRIGTWNVRGMKNKEQKLIEEFEQSRNRIVALTETKRKGEGIVNIGNGHVLIWKGVNNEERAKAEVACLIFRDEWKEFIRRKQ